MKHFLYLVLITIFFFNCNSTKKTAIKTDEKLAAQKQNNTVKIANEELEYEINTKPGNGEIFREYLTESIQYLESSITSLEKAVKTFD